MTTKDLHIAMKRNDGMEYLLSKFAFSEETELFEAIRKIVPVKAEEFIKILKKKQKKFGPKVKNIQIQVLPEDMNTEVSVEVVEQDSEEKEEKEATPAPTLEQLLIEEKKISSIICKIEGEHKEFMSQRRNLVAKLDACQVELKKLKTLLQEQQEIASQTYTEFQECASLMEILNTEKNEYEKQLKEIRNEIENLKKVTIFIYEDSSIEVENMPIQYIEDSQIAAQSKALYELPEAEELTIKEIKTIAKLIIVVDMMERGGYKTECIFDSTKVRKFWETVKKA